MPITAQQAAAATSTVIQYIRREQAHTAALESERRIREHLSTLTEEGWNFAAKEWAQLSAPAHKSPSIGMNVRKMDVEGLKDALRDLGYTDVTEKLVPECKQRGYEWEDHVEVRVFVDPK